MVREHAPCELAARAERPRRFYAMRLNEMFPDRLLRRINVFATAALVDLRGQVEGAFERLGRASVNPALIPVGRLRPRPGGLHHRVPRSDGT
jgi:hypothetical protein